MEMLVFTIGYIVLVVSIMVYKAMRSELVKENKFLSEYADCLEGQLGKKLEGGDGFDMELTDLRRY